MRQAHDKPPCAGPSARRRPWSGLPSACSRGTIRRKSRQGGEQLELDFGRGEDLWGGSLFMGGSLFRGPGLRLGGLCFGSFPQSRMQLTLCRGESFLAQRSRLSGRAPPPEGEQAALPHAACRAWEWGSRDLEEQKRDRACALNWQAERKESYPNRHVRTPTSNMPRFPKAAFLQTAFLAALLLVAVPAPNAAQAQRGDAPVEPGQTFTARVLEVTDGDT